MSQGFNRPADGAPGKRPAQASGFTVVELLICVAIVAILAGISLPHLMHVQKVRHGVACTVNRIDVQNAERQYVVDNGAASASLDGLVQRGYLRQVPECPAGGVYLWINNATTANPFRNLGCSVHYFPVAAQSAKPLTPLGSTFLEISGAFISLMQKYYDRYNRYPRSWGDYIFTDIGLNPADWKKGIEGVIYKPNGQLFNVAPDTGYAFVMKDTKGNERVLTPNLKWNLVYSMDQKKWFYHTVAVKNEIDISTLKIIKS
jgi:prepilin-type N-terminal cleavage/methylation domain-containing protein